MSLQAEAASARAGLLHWQRVLWDEAILSSPGAHWRDTLPSIFLEWPRVSNCFGAGEGVE